ncbi:hypothetical protein ACHHYP_12987 [Achlya hypogyna]|uniref:Regulator of chromosome condensation (RCC1)-like protein n=1 Tax=Achlya hypogyna TaxID=1202772 RepID=A0A1V9YG77_ACHHY|nr:hypothetical protein ACHHYP_12987 [Achlya hypogyna]
MDLRDERRPAPILPAHGIHSLGYNMRVATTLHREARKLLQSDVYAWGYGVEGSLGRNDTCSRSVPVRVTALRNTSIQQVSAGRHLSLFLDDAGRVFQCGRMAEYVTAANWVPRLVQGLPPVLAVAAGSRVCFAISVSQVPEALPLPTRVLLVRTGHHFAAAVSIDGELYTWGWNRHGQLGHRTTADEALPRRVQGLPRVLEIAAGETHVLALAGVARYGEGAHSSAGATVYSWGQNRHGCLGLGGHDRDVLGPEEVQYFRYMYPAKLAAGTDHSLVVCAIGVKTYLYAFGSNAFGQLGLNLQVSFSDTPQCVDEFEYSAASRRIAQIHAGDRFSVALLTNGHICTWGDGGHGKTGHGAARTLTCVPWAMEAIESRFAIDVSIGHSHGLCRFRPGLRVLLWPLTYAPEAPAVMNRFRQFVVPRVASHLLDDERWTSDFGCSCPKALRSSRAPLGLHYHCTTCGLAPLCRPCSLRCHDNHAVQLIARDREALVCQCQPCAAAGLPSIAEDAPLSPQPRRTKG